MAGLPHARFSTDSAHESFHFKLNTFYNEKLNFKSLPFILYSIVNYKICFKQLVITTTAPVAIC